MKLHELKRFSHSGAEYSDTRHVDRQHPYQAPHESKELQMLLDGVKPAALVQSGDMHKYQPYIDQGKLISKSVEGRGYMPGHKLTAFIVGLPGEEGRLELIAKLLIPEWDAIHQKLPHTYDARLGRLLGYTKEQVLAFITSKRERQALEDR